MNAVIEPVHEATSTMERFCRDESLDHEARAVVVDVHCYVIAMRLAMPTGADYRNLQR
jgi:hypothetical protein